MIILENKKLYETPQFEEISIQEGLHILNSLSISSDFSDWQEGEEEDWGTWERK